MKKIRIKIEINDHIIEGIGTKSNNIITLKANDEIIEYDIEKQLLVKENKELIIKLDYLNKKVYYELVGENKKFSNDLVIFSLTNEDKHVMIRYQIEQADFSLKINYETI